MIRAGSLRFKALALLIALALWAGCLSVGASAVGEAPSKEETTVGAIPLAEDWTSVDGGQWGELVLENEQLRFALDLDGGAMITSILDKRLGHEYLPEANPLFSFNVYLRPEEGGFLNTGDFSSKTGVKVLEARRSPAGSELLIRLKAKTQPVDFEVYLRLEDCAVRIKTRMTLGYGENAYLRVTCPDLQSVRVPGGEEGAMATVPHEMGWVNRYEDGSTFGAAVTNGTGVSDMPTFINSVEVATVFADDGSGGFFAADLEGDISREIPRLQMSIVNKRITGEWAYTAEAGETVTMPTLALGVYRDADWRTAVKYQMEHSTRKLEVAKDIPEWLREAGAVFSTRLGGAGGPYQILDKVEDISYKYIHSFDQLDVIYDMAAEYGTNVLMVSDYQIAAKETDAWEQTSEGVNLRDVLKWYYISSYENKGDYLTIREDFGGADAFREGIRKVHEKGGKVLVYMESFIVNSFSNLSLEVSDYAAVNADGSLDQTYPWFYSMIAADEHWQEVLTDICVRMVKDFDIDGIFLDSLGCQWNRNFATASEREFFPIQEYNAGMGELVERIRTAMRQVKDDAVLLSECATGEMLYYTDGGWTADYAWNDTTNSGVLLKSPLKYALPDANLFSNGNTIAQLNQVFAAGYGLALCEYWKQDAEYIANLLDIRREYGDALIYGDLAFLPEAQTESVGSYGFVGDENCVVTVVNGGDEAYEGTLDLGEDWADSRWVELLSGTEYEADDAGRLEIAIGDGAVLVFARANA